MHVQRLIATAAFVGVFLLACVAGYVSIADRAVADEPGKKQATHPNSIRIAETEEGFLVSEGGEPVLFYQRASKSLEGKYERADYVHPLYGLDGQVLTEDFPDDHLHHRGVFWAWHQLYIGDKKLGDAWSIIDFSYDVKDVKILDVNSASPALRAEVCWNSPLWTGSEGREKPFVKEITTIRFHPTVGDIRKIDLEIALLSLEKGFRIGGADNKKAYGGFSVRIKLPDGMEFVGPAGAVEPILTPLPAAAWMDFSGDFGGDGKISGLAILSHESNPGYPEKWILRRKGAMQNAVWPGREPVVLATKEPTVLRYRLIIHRGDNKDINLGKLQAEYNIEPL